MTPEEQAEHDALHKPTHRCPRCGGTSEVNEKVRADGFMSRRGAKKCPVCPKYGPFGMVPEAVAIETALIEDVSHTERVMQAKNKNREETLQWLLGDKVVHCPDCKGTGKWQKSSKHRCFTCNGKGTFQ